MNTPRNDGLPKLLPCPFCNSAAERDEGFGGYVRCANNHCILGGPVDKNDPDCNWYGEAAWNRRASPSVGGLVEKWLGDAAFYMASGENDKAVVYETCALELRAASPSVGGLRAPDALDGATGSFTEGYQHGWNECRDEVLRLNPAATVEEEYEFEVWQNDEMQAGGSGPAHVVGSEAAHYAAIYSQDGPVEVRYYARRRIDETALLREQP